MLNIGLPKGVIKHRSLEIVKRYMNEEIDNNQLRFKAADQTCFYLLKHRDIPRLVHKGFLDIGITSSEWIEERGLALTINRELDWCNTRISLISAKDRPILGKQTTVTCVTEFPNISSKFFAEQNMNSEIASISGSSESLVPSIYDCCIDCVETGSTLKIHNLVEELVIYHSRVVVISRRESGHKLDAVIDKLLQIKPSEKGLSMTSQS